MLVSNELTNSWNTPIRLQRDSKLSVLREQFPSVGLICKGQSAAFTSDVVEPPYLWVDHSGG